MDEPTTALDVVVQQEIMHQIKELQQQLGFSILFITHDISLMVELSHRMAVMYAGKLVEVAPSKTMLDRPAAPLHQRPDGSVPSADRPESGADSTPDAPPNMAHPPTGCRFHPRCPRYRLLPHHRTAAPSRSRTPRGSLFLLVPGYVVRRERSRR